MSSEHRSRRDFLRAGAAATVGTGLAMSASAGEVRRAKHCIFLMLIGGPSQHETWDPKPDAPSHVRGPFGTIATSVTGVRISEHLPHSARLAHRYAIIRSVHHDAPPVHEAGLQLLQTGRLCRDGVEPPHVGALLPATETGSTPLVVLPSALGNLGINVSRGQNAGAVQSTFTHLLRGADRERYGKTAFGDACARSLQLVEAGTRCVVVNMFDTIVDRVTWDCHAALPSLRSTLDDYRRTLCPTFDRAFASLLGDLHTRGLLDETLVIAMGELGRTPRLNANGGRDHWTSCWSIVMAGGGVRGGQVIGSSDRFASTPTTRPVTCSEVAASTFHAMDVPFNGASPIRELFAA